MSVLERLGDQQGIASMPMDEKLLATLYVAILGMGITFLVLIFLQYCIKFMSWLLNSRKPKHSVQVRESNIPLERPNPAVETRDLDEEELIVVIAAAAAAFMGCPANRVVVRNVRRLDSGSPGWARAGLMDQMTMRKS